MEEFIPIVAIVSTFGTIFGAIYIIFMTRHRERMALIESGMDADMLEPKKKRKYGLLKNGIIAMGIGVGLLVGEMLYTFTSMTEEVAYFSMVFLFGGASMLFYHSKVKALEEKEKADSFLEDDFG